MPYAHPISLPLPLAKQIIFRAFLLAQGNAAVQGCLFKYVALNHPDWHLSDEMLSDLTFQVIQAFHRFLTQSWHPPIRRGNIPLPRAIEVEVGEAVLALQYALAHPPVHREMVLSELWVGIVRRDHFFLVLQEGRSRNNPLAPALSPAAPFFSHLCQYGFGQVPVGLAEFDRLFREITLALQERTSIFRRGMAQPDVPAQLAKVITQHNLHYPDAPVVFPLN